MLGWAIVNAVAPHFDDDHGALIFIDNERDAKRVHKHHPQVAVARFAKLSGIGSKQAINFVRGVGDLATCRWL